MRFRHLDLIRYGMFTDHPIDLPGPDETGTALNTEQKVGNGVANGGLPGLVRADNQVKIPFSRSVRSGKVDGTISEYAVANEVEATKAHDYRDSPSPAMWAISPRDTFSS